MNEFENLENAPGASAKQEWERILDEAMSRAEAPAGPVADNREPEDLDPELWDIQSLLGQEPEESSEPAGPQEDAPKPAWEEEEDPLEQLVAPVKERKRRKPEEDPLERLVSPKANRQRQQSGSRQQTGTRHAPQPGQQTAPKGGRETGKKGENPRLRKFRKNRLWLLAYLWLTLEFSEILVRATTATDLFWKSGLWLGMLFALTPALLVFILATSFRPLANRIIVTIYTAVIFLLYASQLVYYKVFKEFYTVMSMGNAGQGFGFMSTILLTVGKNILLLLLLAAPLVFIIGFGKRFFSFKGGAGWKSSLLMLVVLALYHTLTVVTLPLWGTGSMSAYDMYHHSYNVKESSGALGLMTSFRLDFKWQIFGRPSAGSLDLNFGGSEQTTPPDTGSSEATGEPSEGAFTESTTVPTEPQPAYNVTEIDFDALIAGEGDADIRQMHQYFASQTPTLKNDKTGMFEGCNLILITAESFSHLAIDPELTPTLYKMQTEGFNFTNFYTPIFGVSTSDGEYVAMTGTLPKAGVWSFYRTGEQKNYMPLTMVHQLKELGYCAYAYHNHDYGYYDRDLSHPNLGYIYEGMGNGMEEGVTEQWPESDVEMIDFTTPDYINSQPFHAYYMTVSGHREYNFAGGNKMSTKNYDLVKDLPYSETVQAYLATQIELDRAMELLLQRLEEAGVAENTVIVISADHYPYGLTLEEQSELAGHPVDEYFEQYRNACIIYKKGMTPETVDWPCSSLDLLPTLCNLFGLDFDSRLYIGHDMFSGAEPLIIFNNRSWLTDKASYNSVTGEFKTFTDETLPENYEDSIDSIVYNKFTVSAKILDEDYWRILFRPEES